MGLALLVFAAVLISMAIPRASLGQRTQALRRSLATLPATSTAVLGNLSYGTFAAYSAAARSPPASWPPPRPSWPPAWPARACRW